MEYTKLDWILWTATLTQNRDDFDALLAPVMKFIQETPDRMALTDWYETKSPKRVGFTARPVIGGVFLQMLYRKDVWKQYASRDVTKARDWAKLPKLPIVRPVIPTADLAASEWSYAQDKPADGWEKPAFDDSSWKRGKSGFGTRETPGSTIGTEWKSSAIWLRRTVTLPANVNREALHIQLHHDDDVVVYLNGIKAVEASGFTATYQSIPLTPEMRKAIDGSNEISIAIHCRQDYGGQFIDLGFAEVIEQSE